MSDGPRSEFLQPQETLLFRQEFEKDLKFFQLFFLLINRCCPIKKIDLVWAEDSPAGRVGLRQVLGTVDALSSPRSRLLEGCDKSPDPAFCSLVNGDGAHEAGSCGISDGAAAERVRQTGKAQVYRCHAGLTDIAVPVICDGRHIATLLTGQVLREPPSESGFAQIRKDLARLNYIDFQELERAYREVPVVSDKEIDNTIQVLELFAEYLAASWQRLEEAVKAQRRRNRELQLCRKEFAHLVLEGDVADPAAFRTLMKKIGFTRSPNRVLVVRLETAEDYHTPATPFDLAFTAALHAIEELCEKLDNVSPVYLRKRGVCVFFCDRGVRIGNSCELKAHGLAQKLLNAVASRCDMRVRVGLGESKSDWRHLVDSYHEACAALAGSKDRIATHKRPSGSLEELRTTVESVCSCLSENRLHDAKATLLALPQQVNRRLGDKPVNLEAQRQFFFSALDSICFAAQRLSCEGTVVNNLCSQFNRELDRATNIFELQESFLQSAESVLAEIRLLYSGKREKIIERACRLIERGLANPLTAPTVSLTGIASTLRVSSGHLSRTFRKTTGTTFERYLMLRRVALAQRLLLEPLHSVSQVAETCGFSDPTYFARVFRKILGCSPTEYSNNPIRFGVPPNFFDKPADAGVAAGTPSLAAG